MRFLILSMVSFFLLIASCAPKNSPDKASAQQWKAAFLKYQAETDSLFKVADWSPIPLQKRANFLHLNYFNYDPSWRLILTLHPYPHPDSITIMGTKSGDLRPALRAGYFAFTRQGKQCKLEVIKILPHGKYNQENLFLGFWDETSGKETYDGGRYIDLKKLPEGRYLVDFNYAYNPYCAYSHRYSCAIPPMENRLPVPVRAGEKKYGNH